MSAVQDIVRALGAKKCGDQWLARCPCHDDSSPSLAIKESPDGKVLVCCHGGCANAAVVENLRGRGLRLDGGTSPFSPTKPGHDFDRSARASEMWRRARAAPGTLVETYLRARAISKVPPPSLRFDDGVFHRESGQILPALVAGVTVWPSKAVTAVQRIFLRFDGSSKANVAPAKKSLGPMLGGAVRLAQVGERLGLAEGVEDALSVMELDPTLPCWAACGSTFLPRVVLPPLPLARELVIIADNDHAGARAADEAAARFIAEGRRVRVARPPSPHKDFNAALMAARPRPEELGEDERADFEERAAIAEHDGGLSRESSESLAWERLSKAISSPSRGVA